MYNDDLLIKYMVESFDRDQPAFTRKDNGPFITISREFGCQANLLARMLRDEIKKRGQKWSILNKEIIMESAKKLGMEPRQVQVVSESVDRTMMDEVLSALSTKYYKSDRKVRQTIANVITSAAYEGNTIIVGRGGAAITHGMQPSIHIKLYAPIEWRLQSLMVRYHANREHMMKEITSIDFRRHRLMSNAVKGVEDNSFLYDLQINCSTINHKQIVSMVMGLIEERFKIK
ncbi:MAG TPA: cytidylate kinase-like family protein [Lentimicrobium sp.]|nr:cytidylate kinase-like family protein [Lentimicrobium sp.]